MVEICKVVGKSVISSGGYGVKIKKPSGELAILTTTDIKSLISEGTIKFSNAVLGSNGVLYVADGTDIVL